MYRKNFPMDPMISSENSNEYVSSLLHLIGTVLAVAGTTVLIVFSAQEAKWWHLVSFAIYGTTLILSLLFSSIMHFFLLFGKYKRVFGVLDHCAIYMLIAGSYTPFCFTVLRGPLGWWIFGIVWSLAAIFIALKAIFFAKMPVWLSQLTFLAMGWVMAIFIYSIYQKLGISAILLILLGGLFYTVGAIIFGKGRPDPWPPYFGNHEIWHICVLLGNATFYFIMLFFLLPSV